MFKESFFFLPSYKYGHLKRNFVCGTKVEEDVEDVAFPVFAGFCQDHSSGGLTHIILILQFLQIISRLLHLNRNTLSVLLNILRPRLTSQNVKRKKSVLLNWLAGLSQEKHFLFAVSKKSYSETGRRHLWRFVSVDKFFVRVETSRSHLAWSTDDRNLTDFLVIKTNLSKFCAKCDLVLSPQYNAPWSPLFFLTLGVSEGGRA